AVRKLRDALCDDAEKPRYIETIPRRGYRFIATIEWRAAREKVGPAQSITPPRMAESAGDSRNLAPAAHDPVSTSATDGSFGNWRWTIALPLAALLICAVAGYAWWRNHERATAAAEMPIRSLAVLPFDNFSGDPAQSYLSDGMTDELITDLAQIGSLRVTSRSSVMGFKGAHKTMSQIRQELNVDAVVEGSVARSGNTIRVDAQLIETSDDRHLWAQSFTEDEQNIIALQDDVAQAVAERVETAIDPTVRARLANARPVNAEAYEAYLHGMAYMAHHTDADLLKSLDYFKQATAIDPTLATAYAGTAEVYCYLGDYGVLPDHVVWPQAEMAADRAIALDGSIGKAHAALAFAQWRYEWNWKDAEKEFQRALALNPNDADTHHLYGIFLATKGDLPDAVQQLKTASELDPLSLIIRTNVGWLSYYHRDFATAIADYQSVLQSDPQFFPAHDKLWIAYALAGQNQQASAELGGIFRFYHHANLVDRISAQARSADPQARLRAEVLSYANSGYLTTYEKARYLAVAGEYRAALATLETAESRRDSWLVYAGIEPAFERLRTSAQFQHMLKDIGLSDVAAPALRLDRPSKPASQPSPMSEPSKFASN
ncbi:MAG: winged helix-turn-helix domain-containing tetratricopeptide repeat protein, partial [Candidatus Acidiferrales bacterium]